ncbi:organic hydroperoxide resistance protein [Shewanella sp.]|uniref:organic hydroperoxide resistance protein n=1 Tax=Shewanella sp. TaxID=50422 RepID=UPI003F2C9E97
MKALYETRATARAGRQGRVSTEDGLLDVPLAYPKAMSGTGLATNPEQLFAAGYAACFSNAILHVAKLTKVAITEAPVSALVGIGANESGGFALSVTLEIQLNLPQAEAEALVRHAHQICPYSNATRHNIDVNLKVNALALT